MLTDIHGLAVVHMVSSISPSMCMSISTYSSISSRNYEDSEQRLSGFFTNMPKYLSVFFSRPSLLFLSLSLRCVFVVIARMHACMHLSLFSRQQRSLHCCEMK